MNASRGFALRRLVFSALFIAFGLVVPQAFHALGMGGSIFLPMHIPVLIGGLVMGPVPGLIVGAAAPLLSSVLTGMPPLNSPIVFLMTLELAAYGLVAGGLMRWRGNLMLSLVGAMLAGRVVLGLGVALVRLFLPFPGTPVAYVLGSLVSGLPGLAIQLVLVPLVSRVLLQTPVGLVLRESRS